MDAIDVGKIHYDIGHPKPQNAHQRMFVVEIDNYAVCVPYIYEDGVYFLKTAYRDRNWQKAINEK